MVVLAKCSEQNLTEDEVGKLTDKDRRKLMASNSIPCDG